MEGGTKIALAVLGVGLLGLVAYAMIKKPAGEGGGIFAQIGGLWGGASSLTQDVTEKSVTAGRTLGGAVVDASGGLKRIVNDWTPDASDIPIIGRWL